MRVRRSKMNIIIHLYCKHEEWPACLARGNIRIIPADRKDLHGLLQAGSAKKTDLFASDDAEEIQRFHQNGFACIMISGGEEGGFAEGAQWCVYRAEDILQIDENAYEQLICHHNGSSFMIAESGVLRIREYTDNDFESVHEMLEEIPTVYQPDPEAFRVLGTSEGLKSFTGWMYRMTGVGMWICERISADPEEHAELIGWCGLGLFSDETAGIDESEYEMGFFIREGYRGMRYAEAIGRMILEYLRDHTEIEHVWIRTDRNNCPMKKTAQALRFEPVPVKSVPDTLYFRTDV